MRKLANKLILLWMQRLPEAWSRIDAIRYVEKKEYFQIATQQWLLDDDRGLKFLARAIAESKTLTSVDISSLGKAEDSDVQVLIEAFSNHKKITKLRIRSARDRWNQEYRILSGTLQKNSFIEEVVLDCAEFSYETAVLLAEALKVNTGLAHLKFVATQLDVAKLTLIAKALKSHPKLSWLGFWSESFDADCLRIIFSLITENTKIKHVYFGATCAECGDQFEQFLQTNTSLEHIGFLDTSPGAQLFFNHFSRGLAVNKGLKQFDMNADQWQFGSCKQLAKALKTNTTLEVLAAENKCLQAEHIRILCKGIAANNTLKTINFRNNTLNAALDVTKNPKGKPTGTAALYEALRHNTSVTKLDISNNLLYERGYKDLASLLRENKSIRTLRSDLFIGHTSIDPSLQLICESLKVNKTLATWEILECVKFSKQAWDYIREMLKVNQSLTELVVNRQDIPETVTRKLRRNKKNQLKAVKSVSALINMIAMRPDAFTAVFPIEIWEAILRHYKVPLVNFDFEKTLIAKLK